jgi:2-dehydropantoate 2-reductase
MKIAIMGSGGVGGYFGARLADASNDVTFIARRAHLDAIRNEGLHVKSPLGDLHLSSANATSEPADVGPVDVVLFATKLYDTESAGEMCKPFIGDDTVVISLLNGVDSEEQLSRILGAEHVAGGVARISAEIAAPGVVHHHSKFADLEFGEMDGSESDRLHAFQEVAKAAGIKATLRDDIEAAIWEKFILLASFSGVTTLTRLPAKPLRENPDTWELLTAAARETDAVARARGVRLADDTVEAVMGYLRKMPDAMKSSMLIDLENGRRLELDWLSGAVARLGGEAGVDTPVHRLILAALSPFKMGTPAA